MLTQEQIDQFHRDGFVRIRGLFAGSELDLLRNAADHVQAEGVARTGDDHLYKKIAGRDVYYRSERMWRRHDIFQAVTVKPQLLAMVGQCLGHPFRPINDSFVCKLPGGNVPVEWHQDPPYYQADAYKDTFGVPNFDVDIYLDNSTVDNGCLWGMPGRHLVGKIALEQFSEQDLFDRFGAVPLEACAGDVLFHCLSAPHGSAGNRSDAIRRIFYIHYMAREVAEQCYPNSEKTKAAIGQAGTAVVAQMLETRKRMGFDTIDGTEVAWTGDGFSFDGEPHTRPWHWRTLIDAMSQDQIAALRTLKPNPSTMTPEPRG